MEEKQFFLSPDLVYRLAAIDIGTNSIRLIVAEPLRGGNYRILDEEKESTRLGENLSKTGRLERGPSKSRWCALRRMKQIAEGFQISRLMTIATSPCGSRQRRGILPAGPRGVGHRNRSDRGRTRGAAGFCQRAASL